MAVVSEMLIRIAADTAQLRSQMQQAERTVGGSLEGIKNVANQARNALIGFFAIDKAMDLAGAFIKTADAMSQMQARLKLVTSGQKEFESVQQDVYRIAQQNNIGLQEMGQLYAKLHDPVKRLGGTTAETTKITESFALALRVGGASTTEAASATLQFAQAMASGRLNGDEFRSIAEASPRFMKALAEGMNVPIEQLKKMSGEGKLTADVVGNALMKSLGQLQQEAQGIPDTVGGAFTRLKNDVGVFTTELNNATGATSGLAVIVGGLADWVKQITAAFKDWGEATKGTTGQLDLAGIAIRVLGTVFETLIVIGAEVAYIVKGIGKAFSDVATLAKAFQEGGLEGMTVAYRTLRAENEATRDAHNRFTASVVGATDRVLQARDVLRNHSLTAAENSNEMARLTARHGTLQGAVLKSAVANEEATKAEQKRVAEVKKLMDSLEDQTAALLANGQANGKLTKAEQTALKVMQDLQQGRIKLTDAEKRALVASLENLIATEKRIDANRDMVEAQRKVAEHSTKLTEAEWKEVEALREGNVRLMEQNDALRLGEKAVRDREIAVLRATATDKEFEAANQGGNRALEEQARLLRVRADLLAEGQVLQAAKDTADEWKRAAENIERALTDSLMRGFESGKSMMDSLKDYIVNAFKSFVVKLAVQPVMGVVNGVMGMFGMPSSAMASTGGGGGGMSGLSNLITGGMNFLNGSTISAGASGMWTRAGDWMATSSNSTLAGMGDWMQANPAMGSYLGMAGNAMAGYGLGKFASNTISGGYSVGKGYNTFQDIGMAVGSAIGGPIVGAAIGAVTGLVNRAFGRKPKEVIEQGLVGSFGGGEATGQMYSEWRQKGGYFRSDKSGTLENGRADWADMPKEIANVLSIGAGEIYEQIKNYAAALQLPSDVLSSVTTNFRIKVTGKAEEDRQAIVTALQTYEESLSAQYADVLEPFRKKTEETSTSIFGVTKTVTTYFETLAETMRRLIVLQEFSASINQLGGIFSTIAGSSIDAREALIGMAGGIESLMAKASAFVKEYYSQDEQAGMMARDIVNALNAVGIDATTLATRQDFRALVESRNVETEEGRKQLNALLDLAPAFAGVADYIKENDTTIAELIEAAPQVAVLNKILDPTEVTAEATTAMATGIEKSNTLLESIGGKLDSIASISQSAVAAAQSAAAAAGAAASAAANAATSASLAAVAPTYTADLGA
ncbi:MAG: hypothetical protein RL758_62 [Pseudomonadota bacterium]|jgi:tape measure domain-containing protein